MGIFVNKVNDEIRAEATVALAFTRRSFSAAEAVRSVPIASGDQTLKKRMLGAFCYRNVAAIYEGQNSQGVIVAHVSRNIAGDDADPFHIDFGRINGEKDGEGVVGSGVGIYDDFLRRLIGGRP
jgi:hypothetical protein